MGWIELAIGRKQLVESKEKELLWSAVPALGIDPAIESQEDVETQVGYPSSPTTRSGNSTEEAPPLRESCQRGWASPHTDFVRSGSSPFCSS